MLNIGLPHLAGCHINDRLTLGMLITECLCSHVAQPDGAFATAVYKLVAVDRMEFCRCDDLRQLFHVGRFDVNYV